MATQHPDLVLLDIDGVLTDGRILVDESGRETKVVAFEDIDAYHRLRRAGIRLGFITGEETAFVEYVARRFRPDVLVTGCRDKRRALDDLAEAGEVDPARTCFVGDSRHDIPLLQYLRDSFAPSDAEPAVLAAAAHVLPARRGRGVIRALAAWLLEGDRPAAASVANTADVAAHLRSLAMDTDFMAHLESIRARVARSAGAGVPPELAAAVATWLLTGETPADSEPERRRQ